MAKQTTRSGDPNEAAIRDFLSSRLDMIEPGLTLVGTEVRLPGRSGSSGFLDIFCQDGEGKLVIVEIKRTRSAAREALQELYKYVALIRTNHLVQITDYRVILLSVDWTDLLDAYSEFAAHAPFAASAGSIVLGGDGLPERIEPLEPSTTAAPRRFAVRHFLWGFPDRDTADAAAGKLAKRFQGLGLVDFVLIRSRPTARIYAGRHFLYFAQQELSFEAYDELLKSVLDGDGYAEFRENVDGLVELEDRIAEAADAIWSARGTPGRNEIGSDDAEIAHPEKARHWFRDIQQADIHIHRHGRFRDPWLSDEKIVAEIEGEGGASDYRLRYRAGTQHRHEVDELLKRIENVFFYNPDWQGAASQLVRYAQRVGTSEVEIAAFSNEDVLRATAGLAFGYSGYAPTFRMDIRVGEKTQRFIGLLEWDGTAFDFDALVAKHFHGDTFSYFTGVHFGHNRSINRDLLADMGLRYAVFRGSDGKGERIRVQGSTVVVDERPILGSISTMIEGNQAEVRKLVEMFMTTDQGFERAVGEFVLTERADARIGVLVEGTPRSDDLYWCGDIDHCDACGRSFADQQYMIDAIGFRGGGANLCSQCFVDADGRLGTGQGQAYRRDDRGWRLVGG